MFYAEKLGQLVYYKLTLLVAVVYLDEKIIFYLKQKTSSFYSFSFQRIIGVQLSTGLGTTVDELQTRKKTPGDLRGHLFPRFCSSKYHQHLRYRVWISFWDQCYSDTLAS